MRQLFSRPMLLVVCALALSLASCSSNNKGKIVGKWKATSATDGAGGAAADMLNLVMEFTADGNAVMTMSAGGKAETLLTAKYTLGTGDWVTLTAITPAKDGKAKSKDKIKISGDTMTIEGDGKGNVMTFTRMTDAPAGK